MILVIQKAQSASLGLWLCSGQVLGSLVPFPRLNKRRAGDDYGDAAVTSHFVFALIVTLNEASKSFARAGQGFPLFSPGYP